MKMFVTLKGKEAAECSTFAEASQIVCKFRAKSDYGLPIGSTLFAKYKTGRIFDASTNKQIAYVSYNGRVWEGKAEDWTPQTKEIKESELSA